MRVTIRLTAEDREILGYPNYSILVEVPQSDIDKYGTFKAVERQFTWSGYLKAGKYEILDYRGQEIVIKPRDEK